MQWNTVQHNAQKNKLQHITAQHSKTSHNASAQHSVTTQHNLLRAILVNRINVVLYHLFHLECVKVGAQQVSWQKNKHRAKEILRTKWYEQTMILPGIMLIAILKHVKFCGRYIPHLSVHGEWVEQTEGAWDCGAWGQGVGGAW